jgi:hypothetical protein
LFLHLVKIILFVVCFDMASLRTVNKDSSALNFIDPSVDVELTLVEFGMHGRVSPQVFYLGDDVLLNRLRQVFFCHLEELVLALNPAGCLCIL